MIENKDEILKGYKGIIQALTDTSKLDKESAKLQSELDVVTEKLRRCVEENAHNVLDKNEYDKRYKGLVERYESIKKDIEGINEKQLEISAKQENIVEVIKELKARDSLITEFDEELWLGTVEKVIVNTEEKITFVLKDGMELEWNI
ncbi:hypothetical protein [Haloimpatiens massiliensis]|uniref:hypothetical protein n=1 Tax=Haloimpatiens massiliensis TaxID=1658110 RepID=UPI001FA84C63|nr:hypothetical protein [Haloimpatiens massiliensis]